MIDFHSHIVYDVDDGSRTIEDSIEMIKEAYKSGFEGIIFTPHYMQGHYEVDTYEIAEKIENIKKAIKEKGINIDIYQGNEIYTDTSINELINEKKASTINNSKYVLFELPINTETNNLNEVIYQILSEDRIPIIAHPERYKFVQQDPNVLLELIDNGVLFQANYGSVIGQYGKESEKTLEKLLKNNFIHFLGSDVHRSRSVYTRMEQIQEKLRKILSNEKYIEIAHTNPMKVINNEEIEIDEPIKIKQGFFSRFK